METNASYAMDGFKIGLTVIFIILNGFFVAAEFALVKVRKSKLKAMLAERRAFATTALWLFKRQNMALSACQLGITMASLALGWIGEPAIAHIITPWITSMGFTSQALIHGIAFAIAFSLITALHIVIGEQVPKIYAIRRPGIVFLGSAMLLKGFYVLLFPFMYLLNGITNVFLKWLGIDGSGEHDTPLSEEEIRASLGIAYAKGELSTNEHMLLNAVFRFDENVARKIMIPRAEVEIIDTKNSLDQILQFARESRHSRLPYCDGSLDKLFGVIHVKDLLGVNAGDQIDISGLARPAMQVPENIPLANLLQEFRQARQHMAFVQDEHGTILGIVTLEDLLEELVGSLQDEFDDESPDIMKQSENQYLVNGDVLVDDINLRFNTSFQSESDTISGYIVEKFGHKLKVGKILKLEEDVEVIIVKMEGIRITKLQLRFRRNES